jgi:hypothetical protein
MSLYREAGRGRARMLAIAAVVVLIAGLAIGFALGRSTAPEPSGADVISGLRSDLRPVSAGLSLLPNEYAQAYRGEGAELQGVQATIDRMEQQLAKARPDLQALDPEGLSSLERGLEQLATAVKRKDQPAQVEHVAKEVAIALRTVPGGS